MAEIEGAKTPQERAVELLRTGRLVFLQTTGYTEEEIRGLGDLAILPAEKMQELLKQKTLDAAVRRTLRNKVPVKSLRQKKHKKAKRR
jgi:hypothetical protein